VASLMRGDDGRAGFSCVPFSPESVDGALGELPANREIGNAQPSLKEGSHCSGVVNGLTTYGADRAGSACIGTCRGLSALHIVIIG